jgi:YbgC/YbaW family acyl-CoA thioester hydrolase
MKSFLQEYPVVIDIPVAWSDMDAFQHVNNSVYFRYFESARLAYFTQAGMLAYIEETGIGPILASTRCKFIAPLTYPDTVSVGVRITDMAEDRFTMEYHLVSHKLRRVAAEGEGLIVCYNYPDGQKTPIPADLKAQLLEIESRVKKDEAAVGPEATVSLREITPETLRPVLNLSVRDDQKGFVAPNAVSIAEAHFSDKAWFRAIYAGETPIGFLMLYDDPETPTYYLWRFMIDAGHQGKGYGHRAIELLIDYVKTRPNATELLLSHGPGELGPEGFYRKLGFEHTGQKHDGELEMRLVL